MPKLCHLAVLCLLLWVGQGLATTFDAHVVAISDGDTITVLDSAKAQHKIRLAGIDAPDMQVSQARS
jgi:endonuclease YncB( thermonuclease family)